MITKINIRIFSLYFGPVIAKIIENILKVFKIPLQNPMELRIDGQTKFNKE